MNLKKIILTCIAFTIIAGAFLGYNTYTKIYSPNTLKKGYIYIPTNCSFDELETLISPFLNKRNTFRWVAEKKNYTNRLKAGKYFIEKNKSNNEIINLLRSGQQTPVKLVFNNQKSVQKLAGRVSQQIEADSLALVKSLTDIAFLQENGFNSATALCMYLPNTYEFFWNTSADAFRSRMLKEYKRFWTSSNLKKAQNLKLSPMEVLILASIVQEETALVSERPAIAGVYLNRLSKNIKLQADPTVKYAFKQKFGEDTEIKRILYKDLKIASPYNTYLHGGLPPGPIAMPDLSSIKAVLNPDKHNYYYFCGSTSQIGKHEFASTLRQHNSNARKYHKWLKKQGIYR